MSGEPKTQLSDHAREEIDHWIAKFPQGRQRSAVIAALHIVQHENQGYLTRELMDAVAGYLDMPPVQVYEVAIGCIDKSRHADKRDGADRRSNS